MGCGCNKKKKKVSRVDDNIVKPCDVSIKELESFRLLVIKKGDFGDKKNILINVDNLISNYYTKCPDREEFVILKNYVDNVK